MQLGAVWKCFVAVFVVDNMKSKVISLSAISSALIALFLTIGAYIQIVDLVAVVISSVFVILPMYYKSYIACYLTYLAGGLIAFIISGFNIFSVIFPCYLLYFGIYPIVKRYWEDKKVNYVLTIVIGLIWTVAVFYGIYYFYLLVLNYAFETLPKWILDNVLIAVFIVGVVFYFIYDRYVIFLHKYSQKYLSRIIR